MNEHSSLQRHEILCNTGLLLMYYSVNQFFYLEQSINVEKTSKNVNSGKKKIQIIAPTLSQCWSDNSPSVPTAVLM